MHHGKCQPHAHAMQPGKGHRLQLEAGLHWGQLRGPEARLCRPDDSCAHTPPCAAVTPDLLRIAPCLVRRLAHAAHGGANTSTGVGPTFAALALPATQGLAVPSCAAVPPDYLCCYPLLGSTSSACRSRRPKHQHRRRPRNAQAGLCRPPRRCALPTTRLPPLPVPSGSALHSGSPAPGSARLRFACARSAGRWVSG